MGGTCGTCSTVGSADGTCRGNADEERLHVGWQEVMVSHGYMGQAVWLAVQMVHAAAVQNEEQMHAVCTTCVRKW